MASNPVVVACTADTWVKVATNVVTGTIHRLSTDPEKYAHTLRVTGGAAPANDDDASVAFNGSDQLQISSDSGIDVYIKARGRDGSVRIDL